KRHRPPHVPRVGARPVRRAVLQLPARANAEGPTRRAPYLAEGRVPGLTPPLRTRRLALTRFAPRAEHDAAAARLDLERGREVVRLESGQQPLQEGEVHRADDSPVLLGELVEGAVAQPNHALVVLARLVAALA